MADSGIRMGFINSYNKETGMATIYYPDRNHEVTTEMPVLAPFGLLQQFEKEDPVFVLHLSNGTEAGVVLGGYSIDGDVPAAMVSTDGSNLILKDQSGSTTLGSILSRLTALERRL